ncbi:hypothetical protein OJF2_67050 [Aquisphaera giovannonii]|uniref:DUF1501 domain-containing protein n=1 Tax=Aquisphaera giovannonii TaxID=406548 RepID=A0A5B9WC57_9BACT|nr:DUF1501 domain-containing protein [Aquisphaera giovannonii]QEH38107.1 hypothetical protein OJF2_67050 [Aquisphaera giovannonii]
MIRVLGSPKRLCDGLTRRDLLHVGSLGLLGLGAGGAFSPVARAGGSPSGFGRAKSCILLFLYGSPSQIETFDPKPDAPREVRGELGCIATSVPGLNVCEGLPNLAAVMDKVTVIRSVSHAYPVHGVAYATTGNPAVPLAAELSPRDPLHWPFIGSVVDYVDGRRDGTPGGAFPGVPGNMVLPWAFSSRRVGEVPRAGPYGGFLGQAYDPVSTEFVGEGTRKATKTLLQQTWNDLEPYRGITPESRFRLGAVSELGPGLTLDRLDRRRTLLQQIEAFRKAEGDAKTASVDRHRETAHRLLASDRLRQAFDLDREPRETRDLYGMTLFGQAALTARRLVEAGGRFVTVFWDEYGLAGTGWDTHWDHFPRMKDELLPGLDRTLSGLVMDLDRRGLLDETLVVVLSEHGRTPRIQSNVPGGGRDHWSRCYSAVMAGGGIARGRVIGKSDRIASDPVERRVSPKDILATIYHLLGIDHGRSLTDRQGRPLAIVPDAEVLTDAIG